MMMQANVYRMPALREPQEDPLNLRSLPLVDPPADGWPAIEAELLRRNRRQARVRIAGFALAATVVLALSAGLYLRPAVTPVDGAVPEQVVQQTAPPDAAPPETDAMSSETLDSLIAVSQQLESRLRHYRAEVGGMPSNELVYQVELEDLVAQVDSELMMNPDSIELWNQRVMLLTDLSRLYENRLRRDYHQIASL